MDCLVTFEGCEVSVSGHLFISLLFMFSLNKQSSVVTYLFFIVSYTAVSKFIQFSSSSFVSPCSLLHFVIGCQIHDCIRSRGNQMTTNTFPELGS